MKLWIAEAPKKTSKNWKNREVTWEEFVVRLKDVKETKETAREYFAMSKADKDIAKESSGGFVAGLIKDGQRKTENITLRSMITLDADNATTSDWSNFTCLHDDIAAYCYSTHSATERKPRLRWVIPTSRPMTPEEYPAVARKVASWIGINTMDKTTYEVARLFYYPSKSKGGYYFGEHQNGKFLDPDEVLSSYGPFDAWKDTTNWPIGADETEVNLPSVDKLGDPREKPDIIGLFNRVYDIDSAIAEFLSDIYVEAGPNRYTYAKGSSVGGAIVYNNGLLLYSNHATDPCALHSVSAFDMVRLHKFGELDKTNYDEETPVTKMPSYEAMKKFINTLPAIKSQAFKERDESILFDFSDLESDEVDDDDDSWTEKLQVDEKTGAILPSINNAKLILSNHKDYRGKIFYNSMSDNITIRGELPWWGAQKRFSLEELFQNAGSTYECKKETVYNVDKDGPDLYAWFEKFGFTTKGKTNGTLDNALMSVAQMHEFHPIRNYLTGLKWDGIERVDTMFIRWLGAEDNELNRIITRLWMIGAVDRIMRPGCQFEEIIITTGAQGIGKSRMLRILSKGFFTNAVKDLNMSKQTAELLQGVWIVELGELDGIRKGEQQTLKNFISAVKDRYRGAYRHDADDHPRQFVLASTSNELSFLRDDTGERRYWIMKVDGTGDQGVLHGFDEEVDQLWAESYHNWLERMVKNREPDQPYEKINLHLYLDKEHERMMEERRAGFKLNDSDKSDILSYLDMPRPNDWYDWPKADRRLFAKGDWLGDYESCTMRLDKVCLKELKYELLGDTDSKDLRISSILDNAPNWKKGPRSRNSAYAPYPVPMWVRIGGIYDNDWDS